MGQNSSKPITRCKKENFSTPIENKNLEEKIANLDLSLGKVNVYSSNLDNKPEYYNAEEDSKLVKNSAEIENIANDTQQLFDSSTKMLQKANYIKDEKRALRQAVINHNILSNYLDKRVKHPFVDTKARLSEINNAEFREKQLMINRLMYIIYFILYSIALGLSVYTGVISIRFLTYLFIIGLIYLLYALFTSRSFLVVYGDTSMDIAKGITKEIVTNVAPQKKCPSQCIRKRYPKYIPYPPYDIDEGITHNVTKNRIEETDEC